MSALSTFDIFKIGIGPSSSHTMGPMRAAQEFVLGLGQSGLLERTCSVYVRLYGSLALTGAGHGTDRAILAGLEGADPATVDPDQMQRDVARIRADGRLRLAGRHEVAFDEPMQLLFLRHESLPAHPNGMRFAALGAAEEILREEEVYSVGGGFIVRAAAAQASAVASGPPPAARRPELTARSAPPLFHERRAAGALSCQRPRNLRAAACQRARVALAGRGTRRTARHLASHAGVRRARFSAAGRVAGRAQGAPPRAAPASRARGESP